MKVWASLAASTFLSVAAAQKQEIDLELESANLLLELHAQEGNWLEISTAEQEQLFAGVPVLQNTANTAPFWETLAPQSEGTWEALGGMFRFGYLDERSVQLSSFFNEQDALSGLSGEQLRQHVIDGDRLFAWGLDELTKVAHRAAYLRDHPEDREAGESYALFDQTRELSLRSLLPILFASQQADQTDMAKRTLIRSEIFANLAGLSDFIVSIGGQTVENGQAVYEHLGTGFWYRGHVITAAHVIIRATEDREEARLDWSRLRVLIDNGDGLFDPVTDPVVEVEPPDEGSRLFYRWDAACLRLADGALDLEDMKGLSDRYRPHPTAAVSFDSDSRDLEIGVVHGLAAVAREGATRSYWIQPGPIIFPPRVSGPQNNVLQFAGPHFLRALRTEFIGRIADVFSFEDLSKLVDAARTALLDPASPYPSYSPCRDVDGSCTLRYQAEAASKLVPYSNDPGFQNDPRIECFGADLMAQPTSSGCPILLLRNGKQVVVGIHTGMESATTPRLVPPSLSQSERAVPFYRVRPLIDNFIDS